MVKYDHFSPLQSERPGTSLSLHPWSSLSTEIFTNIFPISGLTVRVHPAGALVIELCEWHSSDTRYYTLLYPVSVSPQPLVARPQWDDTPRVQSCYCPRERRKGVGLELQTKVREVFTITKKAPTTGTFSKDVFSQGAVNWVFLGLFNYFLY